MGILRTGVPTVGAIGLALMGGGAAVMGGLDYLLRATFNAPNQGYANGQVLNTVAEGVQEGQLTIVDTGAGSISLLANAASVNGSNVWGETGWYSQAITRARGVALIGDVNVLNNSSQGYGLMWKVGGNAGAPHATNGEYGFQLDGNVLDFRLIVGNGISPHVEVLAPTTDYNLAMVLGGYDVNGAPWHNGAAGTFDYGVSWFCKGGLYPTWTLFFRDATWNDATLYAAMTDRNEDPTIDNFLVPNADLSAVLEPLAKSTFTAANGTSLDAITPEVGGAWNERTGNFDIQTNRSNISASTGVRDVATVPATVADLFARTRIRKTVAADSGAFGHCLRWTDANNFWMVHGNLGADKFRIVERNGGVETVRAGVAAGLTHSTDYDIIAIADAQDITGFLNGGSKVAYGAAALNENVTVHGIVGNQVGQTFDNYHQNARTAAVYDATLNAW